MAIAPLTAAEVARAISALERAIGARVGVMDPDGRLAALAPPDRFYHDAPFCRHVIAATGGRCGAFEHHRVLAEVRTRGASFLKRCHGGVVEHVAPLRAGDEVVGVVYAGPWRSTVRAGLSIPASAIGEDGERLRASVSSIDEGRLLEAGALLDCFAAWLSTALRGAVALPQGEVSRRWQIENLIGRRFRLDLGVDDVARHLRVSPSRARHLVRELFGVTVAELVRRQRIEQAKHLLARSDVAVAEVATRSGFREAGYFNRMFKRAVGLTPGDYRRAQRPASAAPPSPSPPPPPASA